ncbi:hypothetical protein [Fluviispira multicolorata]|uniref:MFS transporter n=1 Tax=Fluviispira multicolorata TaxID=2654512 RepID=A0A833JB07_9BACT|nr:hypothetical protein [Fluviispira multicolorata]KAB8028603.1 hypothetical protein GCL57_12860 [Fluviispira multicolorata]
MSKDKEVNSFSYLRTLSLIGDYAKGFYLPLFIYRVSNGNISLAGISYMFDFLPRLFLTPFFGKLADSKNCLLIVRILELLRVLFILIWYIFYSFTSIWLISPLITVISGILMVFYETSANRILNNEKMTQFQTKSQLLEPAARLIGPMLIGFSLAVINNREALIIIILLYIFTFFLNINTIHSKNLRQNDSNEKEKIFDFSGFIFHFTHKGFLLITLSAMLLNLFFGVFQTLLIPIMRTHYQASESIASLPNILGGSVSIAIAIVIPKFLKKINSILVAYIGATFLFLSTLLVILDIGKIFFSLAFGLLIIGSALFGIFFRVERIKLIPSEKLGNILGANTSLLLFAIPLAGGIIYLLEKFLPSVFMLSILGLFCSAGIFLIIYIYYNKFKYLKNH